MLSVIIGYEGFAGLWAAYHPVAVPGFLASVPSAILSFLAAGLCAQFTWNMWLRAGTSGMLIAMAPFPLFTMGISLISFLMLAGGLGGPLPAGVRASILGLAFVAFSGMQKELNRQATP